MAASFEALETKLVRRFDTEILWIEAWGENGLRVRATHEGSMPENDFALLPGGSRKAEISIAGDTATIQSGGIVAEVSAKGGITFRNGKGEELLREYSSQDFLGIRKYGREFAPILGGAYGLTARFHPNDSEKLYGMGQYQQPYLDVKGCTLELAHRNCQASVPFAVSNMGYGFLWNNPAVGQVTFGKNMTEWQARSTRVLDYWITAGNTPAQIVEQYAKAVGTAPMMPDYAMGFWQCKLRYRTQEELMAVAREHKRRGLPMDVIVADFFHWPTQGDWRFDPEYWPDPDGMVKELKELGIELMVSIWPTVDYESENFEEMLSKGMLMRTDRGLRMTMNFQGQTLFFDATNPDARRFVWEKAKKNYYDKGIRIFWLDEAEPEFLAYEYDNYRYQQGSCLEIGNLYPALYAKTFFDGMTAEGMDKPLNLARCAWAGSQRYGALVWSGDIASTFASFRNQIPCLLNMGLAGIPWWTSDIGGFYGGNPDDPAFRELICRWFQFGVFCPVFRLHGDRVPYIQPTGTKGGAKFGSGSANEVWSYGDEAYDIFSKYMFLRERMKPYIAGVMQEAHEKGTPPARPLFYDFPQDQAAWQHEDEYLFGPDILVAPVTEAGQRSRKVYLPIGTDWVDAWTGAEFAGGTTVDANAPIDRIPLYVRKGAAVKLF